MIDFLKQLLNRLDFLPMGEAFLWKPEVLWLIALGDFLIAAAFIFLPLVLLLLVKKRDDLVSRSTFYFLTFFFLICGLNRLISIVTIWEPVYRLSGIFNLLTGILSVLAAVALYHILPTIFKAPNSQQLEHANLLLRQEIEERENAQAALRQVNDDLEGRVQQRSAQLIKANRELEREIEIRKRAEKDLILKNGELIRINGDLDNFVYCASHDLKSPVVNAEGLVTALREELPPNNGSVSELMIRLDRSIRQMHHTIQDLTEVSMLQKSAGESDFTRLTFSGVLEEVKVDLAQQISRSGVQIFAGFEGGDEVFFTHKNLKSIIFNLVSNAIKYRSPDRAPEIRLHTADSGNFTLLSVADNGIGIDLPKHEKKIFSLFKRLHDHVEGSGVGLFIVKRIMEYNQGRVEVESKVGEGTVFKIYFPKRKAPVTQEV